MTDSPGCLQFKRGSHLDRDRIEGECSKAVPGGKSNFRVMYDDCVNRSAAPLSKAYGGASPHYAPDLKAGDAFLFSFDALHRGVPCSVPRLAISIRATLLPPHQADTRPCDDRRPQISPRDKAAVGFDCVGWHLLPPLKAFSPRLPPHSGGRLLGILGL